MGGWNIIYALINFAVLAFALFLFAKKIVKNPNDIVENKTAMERVI